MASVLRVGFRPDFPGLVVAPRQAGSGCRFERTKYAPSEALPKERIYGSSS